MGSATPFLLSMLRYLLGKNCIVGKMTIFVLAYTLKTIGKFKKKYF